MLGLQNKSKCKGGACSKQMKQVNYSWTVNFISYIIYQGHINDNEAKLSYLDCKKKNLVIFLEVTRFEYKTFVYCSHSNSYQKLKLRNEK